MKDCENTDKQVDFKSEIQKAQEEILGALFPGLSVSKESLDQIQPRIQNASFLPNEQAPTILDFDIVPNPKIVQNHPLVLSAQNLWQLSKYNLYFTNLRNLTISQSSLDLQYCKPKSIGKVEFRNCTFAEIGLIERCFFTHLIFDNCTFEGKVSFEKCTFESSLSFSGCVFGDDASFKDNEFSQSLFKNTKFYSNTYFNNSHFKDYADFHECEFEKTACFFFSAMLQSLWDKRHLYNKHVYKYNGRDVVLKCFLKKPFQSQCQFLCLHV